jgi:hypothetical protein
MGLAACGGKETVIIEREVPAKTPDTIAEVERPVKTYSSEDRFVDNFKSEYPDFYYTAGRKLIIETGYALCESMNEGMTLQDLANSISENDLDPETIGYLAGAAIKDLCPENIWWAEKYFAY